MEDRAQQLSILPSCAKKCLSVSCSLQDLACICKVGTAKSLDVCLQTACYVSESLLSRKSINIACDVPVRHRSNILYILVYCLSILALFCMVSRVTFKLFFSAKQRLERDDWTILSAIPVGFTVVFLINLGIKNHGLGTDLWGVSNEDLYQFGVIYFAISFLYIILLTQIKLSLCFFYLNIFPGKIRRFLWATVVFHIMAATAFLLAISLSCKPLSYEFSQFDLDRVPLMEGSCSSVNVVGWANSAVSIASDVWLIAMPLTQIRKLRLNIKKKIGIILMFLTGAIVTIVSILRMNVIRIYYNTTNPTRDQWDLVWWSTLEITTGFICAWMPTARLILIRIAPKTCGSEHSRSGHALRSSKPREPEPPLCSGHTLPTIKDRQPSVHDQVDRAESQTALCEDGEPMGRQQSSTPV